MLSTEATSNNVSLLLGQQCRRWTSIKPGIIGYLEAEHATSRSRRLPTPLTFTLGWGRNFFVSFKPPRPETEPRTQA